MKHSKTEIIDFIKTKIILDEELQKDIKYFNNVLKEIKEGLKNGKSFKLLELENQIKKNLNKKVIKINDKTIENRDYVGMNKNHTFIQIENIDKFHYELNNDEKDVKFVKVDVWIEDKGIIYHHLGFKDIQEIPKTEEKKLNEKYPELKLITKEDISLVKETLTEAHKCMGKGVSITKSKINDFEIPIEINTYDLYDKLEGSTELVKISKEGLELIHYRSEKNKKFKKGIKILRTIEEEKIKKLLNGKDEIIIKEYIKKNKLKRKQEMISNNEYNSNDFEF